MNTQIVNSYKVFFTLNGRETSRMISAPNSNEAIKRAERRFRVRVSSAVRV